MSDKRDSRSHEDRVAALWTAFGTCKEQAIQSGKINDCSLNKVSKLAGVHKSYLTGTREFKDENVSNKYIEVNTSIQVWKSSFKSNATVSNERKIIKELTEENKNLKDSVEPLLSRLNLLESLSETTPKSLSEKDDQILILRDQLRIAQSSQSHNSKVNEFGVASTIARRIISPDFFRYNNGKYEFGDAVQNQKAMHKAYNKLKEALSRDLSMRLYILVGLPCSGKSTWAENAALCPDRHPVLFDATNLSRVDRLQLTQQVDDFKDLPICCVVLDTPMVEIRKRNLKNRASDRQLPDDVLDGMKTRYEKPDPYEETWINQLIVVHENG